MLFRSNISDYYSARRDKVSDKESLQDVRYENAQVDVQKKNGVKPVETLRNSIPVVQEDESTNVWDRLAKTV